MLCATCINLLDRFGDRYRIGFDPAYDPKGRPRDKLDPWMMFVRCERGEIIPWGGDLLAVTVESRPIAARRLLDLGLHLVQDGDHEKTLVFRADRFDEVAEVVKPRCRRQVSDAERSRLAEMGRRFGFRKSDSHHPERLQQRRSREKAPT